MFLPDRCDICGQQPEITVHHLTRDKGGVYTLHYKVQCLKCDISGLNRETVKEAVVDWNYGNRNKD